MRRFGLLGERLSHSFSPAIHAELGNYEYRIYEKKPEEIEAFLADSCDSGFDGLNVTIPYKKTVIPFCRSLSETARAAGSVNTIVRLADRSLYGDNTDYFGFRYLIKKTKINPVDGKIIVLGSGGSSFTVQSVLRDMGVKKIVVVSRNGTDNYENIENHRDAIMIINTTPVGMYPNNGVSPLNNLSIFKNCRAVIDLIYNPARTELLLQTEELGIMAIDGLAMLVAQAKKSAELFMCEDISDNQIEIITEKISRLTKNIVLIGMPGCGKTSIGAELAKIMGREFADTDDLIEQTAGKSIPLIFAEDGEENFRILETDVLRNLCKKSGLVIATGGGVVKKPDNRQIMRQNSSIIFLERDITQLAVANRPLSEQYGINTLAAERLPLYKEWGEYTVSVCGIEQTAAKIYAQICST